MKNRKKLIMIIVIVFIVLVVGTIICLNYRNKIEERNREHYANIMRRSQPAITSTLLTIPVLQCLMTLQK